MTYPEPTSNSQPDNVLHDAALAVTENSSLQPTPTALLAKRNTYIQQITDAVASGLLRDAKTWSHAKRPPGPSTNRRLVWEKSRALFIDSFRKLFDLDQRRAPADDYATWQRMPVVDVETETVKQVASDKQVS